MAEPTLQSITRFAVLHLALAALVLAATWLGFQTDQRTPVGAIDTTPGVFRGVNAPEVSNRGTYRWTDGSAAICLPQAGRAPRSLVSVRLAGDYALALGTTAVELRPGSGPGVPVALPAELRRYTLLTGADAQAGADLCVSVLSAAVTDPNNNRQLGVPLYGFAAQHLPLAGPVAPAPGQLGLNLALAIAAFWVMRRLGAPTFAATGVVVIGTLVPTIALVSGLVPAGVNPARFQLPVVGGVVATLAGVLVAQNVARLAPNLPRLGRMLLGMAFWSALLVGGFRALQWANGHSSVWPLKAGIDPNPTWWVLAPTALFAVWLWALVGRRREAEGRRQAAGGRRRGSASGVLRPAACLLLFLGAIIIPVALEVSILG